MKTPRAIIFDMDGVIVNSEPLHKRAWEEVFCRMGYGQTHGIHFADYYGRTDLALGLDFHHRHRPTQSIEETLTWKQGRLIELLRVEEPIFDGLPELLEKLAARFRLGVASGSTHPVIDQVLALKQLRRFFSALVSSTDVPRGKPAPDVFLRAAELLGVAPGDCVVVEDATTGIEGALAAGMQVIAIANSLPPERLARATRVVRTYVEIEHLLCP